MKSHPTQKNVVPKQEKGAHSDTLHSRKLASRELSKAFFKIAKKRLLNVSDWHNLGGLGSASFVIINSEGHKARRLIHEGDFIRINIPGPGNKNGDGFDWVRVEKIVTHHQPEKDLEQLSMKVKPSKNPLAKTQETSHFFDENSSSTFIVVREKNFVTAEVHGRNELPNVESETPIDSIRNAFVALGAMLGLSKLQWSKLVKGLVEKESN